MKGVYLEDLNWYQAESLLATNRVMLLPVGAQTKEHGPHLPLSTDWLTVQYLTKALLETCEVIALPALAYGYYPAFTEYPGSVTLEFSTFRDTVLQIIKSLHRHGAKKFYVLNTGVSTNQALDAVKAELEMLGIVMDYTDQTCINLAVEREIEMQPRGSHADELETSMMLYMYPDRVDMTKAVPELNPRRGSGGFTRDRSATSGIFSPTGSWGDPTLATVEKGKRLTCSLIERLEDEINQLDSELEQDSGNDEG